MSVPRTSIVVTQLSGSPCSLPQSQSLPRRGNTPINLLGKPMHLLPPYPNPNRRIALDFAESPTTQDTQPVPSPSESTTSTSDSSTSSFDYESELHSDMSNMSSQVSLEEFEEDEESTLLCDLPLRQPTAPAEDADEYHYEPCPAEDEAYVSPTAEEMEEVAQGVALARQRKENHRVFRETIREREISRALEEERRTSIESAIPFVSQDTLSAIKALVARGAISVPLNGEVHSLLSSAESGDLNVPLSCTGCPNTCIERWSVYLVRQLSDSHLLNFFSDHGCTFRHGLCVHQDANGRPIVCRMGSTCPFPRCNKVDTNSVGPLFSGTGRAIPGGVAKKTLFFLLHCNGIGSSAMRSLFDIGVSMNTLTEWRRGVDEILAAAHHIKARQHQGTVMNCQFDEFVISSPKYGRGRNSSARDGQMWFQSCVALSGAPGGPQRVLKYFVRFVPNRSKETLVPWMLSMVGDGARVATDCWSAYDTLVEEGAKVGKTITHYRVNHSIQFANHNGHTTNAIEGMHHQTKRFLAMLGVSGTSGMARMVRVLASAELCNISDNDAKGSFINRFRRFMESTAEVVSFGVPVDEVLACANVGKDLGTITKAHQEISGDAESDNAGTPSRRSKSKLVDESGVEVFPAAASATKRSRSLNEAEFDAYRVEARQTARAAEYAETTREERLRKKHAKLQRALEKQKLEGMKRDRQLEEAKNNKYAATKREEALQKNIEACEKAKGKLKEAKK